MAITVTPRLTLINTADNIANWSVDAKATNEAVDAEFYKEGAGSYGATLNYDAHTAGKDPYDFNWIMYNHGTNLNFTGSHIYFIWNTAQVPFMYPGTSGVRFEANDGSNTAYWYLAGKNTYEGGWVRQVVDISRAPDEGTCDITAVDSMTFHLFLNNQSAKAAVNTWVDIYRYGDGLVIGSGSSSTPGTFSAIDTIDNNTTNAYGIIRETEGIYTVQGKLIFGSGTAIETYFSDAGETVIFRDTLVSSNLYEITVSGTSTSFELGAKAGSVGIQGCTITQPTLSLAHGYWRFDAGTYLVSGVRLYGSTFVNASDFTLPKYDGDKNETLNCNFIACQMLYPSTSRFSNNNIISCVDRALYMESGSEGCGAHQSGNSFISCPSGIIISSQGTYTLDAHTFAGCTYDIVNVGESWISCNNTNGCNAGTYVNTDGGTTKILSTINITVTPIDEDNNNVSGAVVAIYSGQTDDALSGAQLITSDFPITTWDGSKHYQAATSSFNYANWNADIPVTIRIRKSTPATGNRYFPYKSVGTITNADFNLTATLIEDTLVV